MIRTLTVTIGDEDNQVSIRGTQTEGKFNETVVLVTPTGQVAVNSQELAKCLAEVVDFQAVIKKNQAITLGGSTLVFTNSGGTGGSSMHLEGQSVSAGHVGQAAVFVDNPAGPEDLFKVR